MKIRISNIQIWALFSLVICIIMAVIGNSGALVMIPLLFLMVTSRRTKGVEFVYCLLAGIILIIFRTLHVIEYPLFPQAASLYYQENNLFYWLNKGHEHAVRLLVTYPGILIANKFSEEITWGVTIYSISLLILIMYFMMKIIGINRIENRVSALLCGTTIVGLALVMNGRLIFAFWGTSLLTLYELKYKNEEVSILTLQIITAISVLFSTVSSGTMFVITTYVVLITPYRWQKIQMGKEKIIFIIIFIISLFPVINIFVPYLQTMFLKNIIFFGGGFQGIVNMMQHGLGKVLQTSSISMVYVMLIIGVLVLIANIHLFRKYISRQNNPNLPLFLLVNLSGYGSIFGLSTGLTALIPLLVLIIERFHDVFSAKSRSVIQNVKK